MVHLSALLRACKRKLKECIHATLDSLLQKQNSNCVSGDNAKILMALHIAIDHVGALVIPPAKQAVLACTCVDARDIFSKAQEQQRELICSAQNHLHHAHCIPPVSITRAGSLSTQLIELQLPSNLQVLSIDHCIAFIAHAVAASPTLTEISASIIKERATLAVDGSSHKEIVQAEDSMKMLSFALAMDASLQRLQLHQVHLGTKRVQALAAPIIGLRQNTSLKSLDLSDTGIDATALCAIMHALRDCSPGEKQLQRLSLEINPLTSDVSNNVSAFTNTGIHALGATVEVLPQLDEVFLHCTGCTDASVAILLEALQRRKANNLQRLQKVSFAANSSISELPDNLTSCISAGAGPRQLYFASCALTESAAKRLSDALASAPATNPTSLVALQSNPSIGYAGLKHFKQLEYLPSSLQPEILSSGCSGH